MDTEYHKQKSREHYQKHKKQYNERNQLQKQRTREIIAEAKKEGCSVCSEKEPACLDFHHLHGKDLPVSAMLGMKDERVRNEISKCIILCSNCHRKLHAGIIVVEQARCMRLTVNQE